MSGCGRPSLKGPWLKDFPMDMRSAIGTVSAQAKHATLSHCC